MIENKLLDRELEQRRDQDGKYFKTKPKKKMRVKASEYFVSNAYGDPSTRYDEFEKVNLSPTKAEQVNILRHSGIY